MQIDSGQIFEFNKMPQFDAGSAQRDRGTTIVSLCVQRRDAFIWLIFSDLA